MIDSSETHVPITQIPISFRTTPHTHSKTHNVTAVLDTGANMAACGAEFALRYKHLRKPQRSEMSVMTGNGPLLCKYYIPIYIQHGDRQVFVRLYELASLPYDVLLGRSEMATLGYEIKKCDRAPDFVHKPSMESLEDTVQDDDYAHRISYPLEAQDEIDWDKIEIDPKLRNKIEPILKKYSDTIALHEFDVGCIKGAEFPIDLKDEDMDPIVLSEYHHSREILDEGTRQIKLLCKHGFMQKSQSPWRAPALAVKKKTGDIRLVFDWRKLNQHIPFLPYPIPNIQQLIEKFEGKKYVTSLDAKSGYWHIPMREKDIPKTAFVWDGQLYEWLVMPMGLNNAPSYFQMTMDAIFEDLDYVLVYLDDVCILSDTAEQHEEHLKEVFQRLVQYNIKLRIDKCAFGMPDTVYLGFRVNHLGSYVTKKYLEKVLSVPRPRSKKGVQRFLGLVNYLHRFIPNLHLKQENLVKLTHKNVDFEWTEVHNKEFELLKQWVKQQTFLRHPDYTKQFYVVTDASNAGIGGMLAQMDDKKRLRPVAFGSKKFNETQQKWHVSEQEIYAVIYFVEKWRHVLWDRHFVVYTDHKNLADLFNKGANFRTGKLYRWAIRLLGMHFTASYLPGSQNVFADYLSRDENGLEEDNERREKAKAGIDIKRDYEMHCTRMVVNNHLFPIINEDDLEIVQDMAQSDIKINYDQPQLITKADRSPKKIKNNTRKKAEHEVLKKQIDSREVIDTEPYTNARFPNLPFRPKSVRIAKKKKQAAWKKRKQIIQHTNNQINSDSNLTIVPVDYVKKGGNPVQLFEKIALPRRERVDRERNSRKIQEQRLDELREKIKKENIKRIEDSNTDNLVRNPILLQPEQTSIPDLYDIANLRTKKVYEKQIRDPICYAIHTFLTDNNQTFLNDLPHTILRYVHSGRYTIGQTGLLLFKCAHKEIERDNKNPYKVVIPSALRQSVLHWGHDVMHHGGRRMKSRILQHFWWPKMNNDILRFARCCTACMKRKRSRSFKGTGKMKLFSALRPFEQISVDIVGPMPITNEGYRYIVTMIDKFSRLCMLVPVMDIKTMSVVHAIDQWYAFYGAPEAILSDNGSQFTSAIYRNFAKEHNVKLKFTTAYHPECNGQIERLHRWIKERLALIAYDTGKNFMNHDDWVKYLHVIMHAYNTTSNQMTSYAPTEIIFGRNLKLPIDHALAVPTDRVRSPAEFIEYMANRRRIIVGNANAVQEQYDAIRKRQHDKKRKKAHHSLKVGDYVYYDVAQRYVGNVKKLSENYIGPWEIVEIFNDGQNFRLIDCSDGNHRITTHRNKLKFFKTSETLLMNAPTTNLRNYWIAFYERAMETGREILNLVQENAPMEIPLEEIRYQSQRQNQFRKSLLWHRICRDEGIRGYELK